MGEATEGKIDDDSAVYKTLLESTKAIPWKIDWATMAFAYIGPQIEPLLGWPRESWLSANDWATRIHEEDRDRVVNFCIAQSKAGVDHEADYRALTRDGHYVWIRDVVHVVRREDGTVDSLIGFMFDISERKAAEQELLRLQKELETLSFQDGLTGIANRRMLDSALEKEWASGKRNGLPLSVVLIDIDYFKQYNDHYGHLQGDECLQRVAAALCGAAVRPRDLLARYGGEEFVVVLPETDEAAALKVAERCRKLIFEEEIPHRSSGMGALLTVSLGVATAVPTQDGRPQTLIERADRRLYLAKQRGRNCIVGDDG
jgi:diguanylate cyclase (GGDEF)-like protein/PAS domain S-box-containing protein